MSARARFLVAGSCAAFFVLGTRAQDAEGEPPCTNEEALSRAAAELLLAGGPPAPDALDRAVREAGSDAVGVRALYLRDEDPTRERAWIQHLVGHGDAPAACGRAVGTSGVLIVAANRGGALDAIDARSTRVRGSLADGFSDAEIVVSDANAALQRVPVDRAALAQGIEIADDLARPARVQLVAHGPSGPRPLAERVIPARGAHGANASAAEAAEASDAAVDAVAPGAPIASQLASFRAAERRPRLRDNRLLAAVAAAHAARVCVQDHVAHELGRGDPEQRLRAAGIEARLVGETVARAVDDDAAFAAMRRSPSHRMTLLDERFTDAGAGAVRDARGRSCLVVLFAAWPRYAGN